MSKLHFRLLNISSLILVVLLLAHFVMGRLNARLGNELRRDQAYINGANQVSAVLDRLAQRIALGSDTDPRLRDLLIKYGLTVTLDVQGKKKKYP